MSTILRVLLILVSAGTFGYIIRKIRKAQVQIVDVGFWVVFSLALLVMAIFPQIPTFFMGLIGIDSPANGVFLAVIFILMVELFFLSLKVSRLESKLTELVGEVALKENEKNSSEQEIPK